MKRIIVLVLCLAMLVMGVACTKGGSGTGSDTANNADATPTIVPVYDTVEATLVFEGYGRVDVKLYPQYAPQSVFNFLYLARNNYFNGTIVHRISKGFCIELGKVDNHNVPKEVPGGAYGIKGEFSSNNVNNQLGFGEGTLVWARDPENPDSACNSFMIMLDANLAQGLVGDYAPFGKVTAEGMKIIKKIGKIKVLGEEPTKVVELINVEIHTTFEFPEPEFIRPSSDKAD